MAEAKRYYWLKLGEDFFRQKEIKKLRRIAGGDTFTIIYLKMLLRAMKDDGRLYFEGVESDFSKELALDIDEDDENVAVTVQFLLANGILIQHTVSEFELTTNKEMTGSECDAARRMRKMRAAKKLELPSAEGDKASQCYTAVTDSYTEIEKEKEKEIDTRDDTTQAGFDRFWAVYPRRVAKVRALRAWTKLKPDEELIEAIITDVERRKEGEWKGQDVQFIPHPATYLNQRRWEDEQATKEDEWHEPDLEDILRRGGYYPED